MAEMEIHPAALIFPEMGEEEYRRFVESIRVSGLLVSIKRFQGKIIDGRHRYRACLELGIESRFEDWDGADPVQYVIDMNLHRRQLDDSQRALVAARMANLGKGNPTGANQHKGGNVPIGTFPSQEVAAGKMNVSKRSVVRAKAVIDKGAPELVAAVEKGDISIFAATDLLELPQEEQKEVVQQGKKAVVQKAKEIRGPKKVRKKHHMEGKHYAKEEEVDAVIGRIRELRDDLESMGGLKKLVSNWKDDKRWTFCDQLEAIARTLRGHAMALRHHSKIA